MSEIFTRAELDRALTLNTTLILGQVVKKLRHVAAGYMAGGHSHRAQMLSALAEEISVAATVPYAKTIAKEIAANLMAQNMLDVPCAVAQRVIELALTNGNSCPHIRLNEEGICRNCGENRSGI